MTQKEKNNIKALSKDGVTYWRSSNQNPKYEVFETYTSLHPQPKDENGKDSLGVLFIMGIEKALEEGFTIHKLFQDPTEQKEFLPRQFQEDTLWGFRRLLDKEAEFYLLYQSMFERAIYDSFTHGVYNKETANISKQAAENCLKLIGNLPRI